MPVAVTWMQLEIIIPSEVSLKEKDTYNMMSLKYDTNEPIYKAETDSQIQIQFLSVAELPYTEVILKMDQEITASKIVNSLNTVSEIFIE